jgi:hypothetical protein
MQPRVVVHHDVQISDGPSTHVIAHRSTHKPRFPARQP